MFTVFILDLSKVKSMCLLIQKWYQPKGIKHPLPPQELRWRKKQKTDTPEVLPWPQLSLWALFKNSCCSKEDSQAIPSDWVIFQPFFLPIRLLLAWFLWNLFQHPHLSWAFEIPWPSPDQGTSAPNSITYFPLILQRLIIVSLMAEMLCFNEFLFNSFHAVSFILTDVIPRWFPGCKGKLNPASPSHSQMSSSLGVK